MPTDIQLKTLVHDFLKPQVTAIDLEGAYPGDILRRLGAIGGFGGLVEGRYGGTGRGSPMSSVRSRRSGGYVVNGNLSWVPNMAEDHYVAVGAEATGGRAMLLVHRSTPGVRLSREAKLGRDR